MNENSKKAIAPFIALLEFVSDPFARRRLRLYQYRRNAGSLQLAVDPILDGLVSLFLNFFP
jgi:hypothetical protein